MKKVVDRWVFGRDKKRANAKNERLALKNAKIKLELADTARLNES